MHCIGGIIGALLTGALVSKEISGSDGTVLTQLWGVGTTLIYGFIMSMIILKLVDLTIGLRVTVERGARGPRHLAARRGDRIIIVKEPRT